MKKDQWDVLVFHHNSPQTQILVSKLKQLIKNLKSDVGEEIKVASTAEELFIGNNLFDSMDDALKRCSWMFILITQSFLDDPTNKFVNNQALMHSICSLGEVKYVPIYESYEQKSALPVPSHIKALTGVCITDLENDTFQRTSVVRSIKATLIARKERERVELQRYEREIIAQDFKRRLNDIRADFQKKKLQLKGEAEVRRLRERCSKEILKLAKDQNIDDLDSFLSTHEIDISFVSDATSSISNGKFAYSLSISQEESAQVEHNVDAANPSGKKVPVEHDTDAVEDEDMGSNESPPRYSEQSTASGRPPPHIPHMEQLKPPPPNQSPAVVGGVPPLEVPPCGEGQGPPVIPTVVEDLYSNTTFSSVPRLSGYYEQDVGSMIAECSESSVHDSTSLLGSQSHANLTEFDEDNMSQFSKCSSDDSCPAEDMEVGDNPVDLSLLEVATGHRPLPLDHLRLENEGDDESMVVEVDSTVGVEPDDSVIGVETKDIDVVLTPICSPKKEPNRIMHRSICSDYDDDFDMVEPLQIDAAEASAGLGTADAQVSPSLGLAEIVANSWPRHRRGSDVGGRRPQRSNLTSTRFLSLSSLQSFSSQLFKLQYHPSLNNISEWVDKPKKQDGIRCRFS